MSISQQGKTPVDVTLDNGIGFSIKLLNMLWSLHIHISTAQFKSIRQFLECKRLIARIFDCQLRLNLDVSFLVVLNAIPLIFSLVCLAFVCWGDGQSLECSF